MKRIKLSIIVLVCLFFSCAAKNEEIVNKEENKTIDYVPKGQVELPLEGPSWLRNAVIAEIPIRGFAMDNYGAISGYGQGTFEGIVEKLDFLKSVGVNVLCLYSVYDCTASTSLYALHFDRTSQECGSIEDVKTLCDEAHKREMYVISNTNYYGVDKTSPVLKEHPDWFLNDELFDQPKFDFENSDAFNYVVDSHVMWCVEAGLDGYRIDCGVIYWVQNVFDEIIKKCDAKGKRILIAPEQLHCKGHIQGAGHLRANIIYDMLLPITAGHETICPIDVSGTDSDPYRSVDWSSHNTGAEYDAQGKYCATNLQQNKGDCGRGGAHEVKGSRFIYGYNMLFGIHTPWFMVGEAFDATHLMVPYNTNGFWSKFLHSSINWNDTVSQKNVITDFRKIAQIRSENGDIFHNNQAETNIINVPYEAEDHVKAVPYTRYIPGKKAAVVIGNENIENSIEFKLNIPLSEMGLGDHNQFRVVDLWTNEVKELSEETLSNYTVTVPKDKSLGGGVRVIMISPISSDN